MRSVLGFARSKAASLWLIGLLCACFAPCQDLVHELPAPIQLRLIAAGNGSVKKGEIRTFRTYEAADGTKGVVFCSQFESRQAAQRHIEEAIKITSKIVSRKQNQVNEKGQLVSDRILAVATLPDSHREEYVVIRRDGLICYFIESVSLQVATEIEVLIQDK